MIGNKRLEELYEYHDRDVAISQMLELIKVEDSNFLSKPHKKTPCSAEGRREFSCDINYSFP